MKKIDEIRLLIKGIHQLRSERQAQIEAMTEKDPFTTLESIFDKLNRYDILVSCLIRTLWDQCSSDDGDTREPRS